MINVVCVWTGGKYSVEYVYRLRNMVQRHLTIPHRFYCLTSMPAPICDPQAEGITWDCTPQQPGYANLRGWWTKMLLLSPYIRPGIQDPCVYFDLDTVICGDLKPLVHIAEDHDFSICSNFTRLRGNVTWPCRYGSCVMTFGAGWGREPWEEFLKRPEIVQNCQRYGDQLAIETLVPNAVLLQEVLPNGYFIHYKDLQAHPRTGAAVVVFGGRTLPDNCGIPWVAEYWK